MAVPIWKDYYVDFGQEDYVDYEIRLTDGTIIFSGRSYPKPGDMTLKVKINDICADYLDQMQEGKPKLENGFDSNDIAKEFRVFTAAGTLIETVTFINDWSYDESKSDSGELSSPINGKFDIRMPITYSVSRARTFPVVKGGTTSTYYCPSAGTFTLKYNEDGIGNIKVGNILFIGMETCCTHALYYINAYGGWDSLLLEGRTIEIDGYTRHESKMEYNNTEESARGTRNYLNEVEKSFVLHTGWMKNSEAAKMHHLLGSTEVYLYDMEKSGMIPVVITDNSCKYKTFQNEGGKMVEYEINVKVAKQMIRR